MNKIFKGLAPALALSFPLLSGAQQGSNPSDTKTEAPLRYKSAFADYKPWQDITPGDWRQLNIAVQGAHGMAGHNMGAPPPAAEASAPGTSASAPQMPGHAGHKMHGGKP